MERLTVRTFLSHLHKRSRSPWSWVDLSSHVDILQVGIPQWQSQEAGRRLLPSFAAFSGRALCQSNQRETSCEPGYVTMSLEVAPSNPYQSLLVFSTMHICTSRRVRAGMSTVTS
jgi:hypothetical protein